jgi:hypothetical protein
MSEHLFVPKGSPHAHFQRAIERRHLLSAETAARELLQPLNLSDALTSIGSSSAAVEVFAELGARYRVAKMETASRPFRTASCSSGIASRRGSLP